MQAKERYSKGAYSAAGNYKRKAKITAWIGIVVGLFVTLSLLGITVTIVVIQVLRIQQLQRS